MSYNNVSLLGRLGQPPELSYTPAGQAVCKFTVATSDNWTDKSGQKQEKVEWHRIVVWGKLGELCNQYLIKGSQVFLTGKLSTRSWDAQDGTTKYMTEIIANNVQFLGSKGEVKRGESGEAVSAEDTFTSDDIPF